MNWHFYKKFLYPADDPLSSLTHFLSFCLSITGLILLIIYATRHGTVWHLVGFSIFGTSLMLMYLVSSLYHFFPLDHRAKKIMRRVDHAMIYVLIAGTYTPICFLITNKVLGWSIFSLIWGLAIVGIILKASRKMLDGWRSLIYYLLMGWLAVVVLFPLAQLVPLAGLLWLFAGGVFYTLGTIFYGAHEIYKFNTRWFSYHAIFHLFVMAGSFCHFWLMFKYIVYA
ncbi:MAG: hemolysin III family protein [Candidatus Falkowbacteria bacterium]|nr:hemolysin III family protein [Candidatus Falkowbacteria bacterium]